MKPNTVAFLLCRRLAGFKSHVAVWLLLLLFAWHRKKLEYLHGCICYTFVTMFNRENISISKQIIQAGMEFSEPEETIALMSYLILLDYM